MKEEVVNNTFEDNELAELKKKASYPQTTRHVLKIDECDRVIGWFERIVRIVHKYGVKTVLFTFLMITAFIALLMFANAVDNQQVIEKWLANKDEEHILGNDIRKDINPKVTSAMTKLMYKMGADRVSVIEMHNGKENPTSLPFVYCDMTYEETRDSVEYVAEEYVDLNMSKFSFPAYLYSHRYFIGTIDEVYAIDKKLAFRLEANDVKYCGIILIRTNIDIGFLMLSYLKEPTVSKDTILAELSYYVQEIGSYLDYAKQMDDKKDMP